MISLWFWVCASSSFPSSRTSIKPCSWILMNLLILHVMRKNASQICSGKEKHCSMDCVMISHQHYLWVYKMNSLAIAGIQVQNTILKNTNSDIKLQESKLKTQTLTSNSRNPSSKHKLWHQTLGIQVQNTWWKNRNFDIKLTASLVSCMLNNIITQKEVIPKTIIHQNTQKIKTLLTLN